MNVILTKLSNSFAMPQWFDTDLANERLTPLLFGSYAVENDKAGWVETNWNAGVPQNLFKRNCTLGHAGRVLQQHDVALHQVWADEAGPGNKGSSTAECSTERPREKTQDGRLPSRT